MLMYPNKPWDGGNLIKNSSTTIMFVKKFLFRPLSKFTLVDMIRGYRCIQSFFGYTPCVPKELLFERHFGKPHVFHERWHELWHDSIPEEFIERHFITPKFIDKHIDLPWDWYRLSRNPNVTPELIEKYLDKPWNWEGLSLHPNLTSEFIEKHFDKRWDWNWLSRNKKVTLEFIESNMDKPWEWSLNPNLTIPFIRRHVSKVDWKALSRNELKHDKSYTFLEELEHTWWMPPNASDVPVFAKGGRMFHEGMNEAMSLIK